MKRKKNLMMALTLFSAAALASCSVGGTSSNPLASSVDLSSSLSSGESKVVELIQDNRFQKGFALSPADRSKDDGSMPDNRWPLDVDLVYGGYEGNPVWAAHQHGCVYGLGDVYNKSTQAKPTYENGFYTFEDTSKRMSVNPTTGTLDLELNASKEYEHARKSLEAWPHLILDGGLSETIVISDLKSLDFSIDLTMTKLENHMSEDEYDENLHTVQFLMYFICNSSAALDANDYMWFGVPFLDYRYKVIPETGMKDYGTSGNTGKYIYSMSTETYLPNGIEVGVKNEIRLNLIDEFGYGLVKAQSDGFLVNSKIADLSISYMNIGFEIPGTFDCGMEMSNFSLEATKK